MSGRPDAGEKASADPDLLDAFLPKPATLLALMMALGLGG
jgi:hypothetical protein